MRIDQMKRILLISFTDLISMPMWYADHERGLDIQSPKQKIKSYHYDTYAATN